MNKYFIALILSTCAVMTATPSQAEQVWTEVTRVEPLQEQRRIAPKAAACQTRKPGEQRGLATLLAWDLTDCVYQQINTTTGYRVHYQWAGHSYSYFSKSLPGQKIKLDVDVRPQ